ncbi:hypothetical protein NXV38_13715 [Bacteroides caccae]|nr:hypothetical protein [Bacteroides caccae]
MKQEIITYLAGPRNFIQGVELYEKYGINRMLKKSFRRQGETETMKAILLEELRKLAGLSEREFKTIRRNSKQLTAVKMEPAREETSKTPVKYSDDLLLELAESFGVSVEELVSSDFGIRFFPWMKMPTVWKSWKRNWKRRRNDTKQPRKP